MCSCAGLTEAVEVDSHTLDARFSSKKTVKGPLSFSEHPEQVAMADIFDRSSGFSSDLSCQE